MNIGILDYWVSRGFCLGAGDGYNDACVQQAVALCLGEELSDHPSCVNQYVSYLARKLNDCFWSTDLVRAAGISDLAYEQLGSLGIDEKQFEQDICTAFIKELLPDLSGWWGAGDSKRWLYDSSASRQTSLSIFMKDGSLYLCNIAGDYDGFLRKCSTVILKCLRDAKERAGLKLFNREDY